MEQAPRAGSTRAGLLIMGAGLLLGLLAGLVVFVEPAARPAGGASGGPTHTPAPAPVTGAPAPDFTLPAIDGSTVTLSDLEGQVVVINFWATWCGPCRLEMPSLQARYDRYKDQGFTILAVNFDESLEAASGFAVELGLTFPVLLDVGAHINDLYRVQGYPASYIVNRDGLIVQRHVGIMSERQLDEYLGGLGLAN